MLIIPDNCDWVGWLFIAQVGGYCKWKGVGWIADTALDFIFM